MLCSDEGIDKHSEVITLVEQINIHIILRDHFLCLLFIFLW